MYLQVYVLGKWYFTKITILYIMFLKMSSQLPCVQWDIVFNWVLVIPFKSWPDDLAWSISRRNFRISAVPFSMMSFGGNSMGLLLIFRPFKLFIKPKIDTITGISNHNFHIYIHSIVNQKLSLLNIIQMIFYDTYRPTIIYNHTEKI